MYLILTTALEDRYNYCISLYKANYGTELGRSRKATVILDSKFVEEVSPWEVTFKQLSEVCFLHISKMHASLSTHSTTLHHYCLVKVTELLIVLANTFCLGSLPEA